MWAKLGKMILLFTSTLEEVFALEEVFENQKNILSIYPQVILWKIITYSFLNQEESKFY